MQQIDFTGNLDEDGNKKIFVIIKAAKETDEQMVHQLILNFQKLSCLKYGRI